MAVGDTYDDATGRGASARFQEQRRRAAELQQQWDEDGIRPLRRAEFDSVAAENVIPHREERALHQRTLRSTLGRISGGDY